MPRTPTIAVVDRTGSVTSMWIGSVTPGLEDSVVDRLLSGSPDVSIRRRSISTGELEALRAKGVALQLVDPRRRGQRPDIAVSPDAVAIPAGELWIRAPYELDRRRLVVVDCRVVGGFPCETAIRGLRSAGFSDVTGLSLPSMGHSATCVE